MDPILLRRSMFCAFIGGYLVLSVYVMAAFACGSGFGANGDKKDEVRPIVYRALMPAIIHGAEALVPESAKEKLRERLVLWRDSPFGQSLMHKAYNVPSYGLSDGRIVESFFRLSVVYATLLLFIAMFYALAHAVFPHQPIIVLLAPVIALEMIADFSATYAYVYDYAELFFSCACLYFLFKRRWAAYLACFALGTLNKESTICCLFFFMAWYYNRMPYRQYSMLLAAQIGIYALVKLLLAAAFADRPGMLAENHLIENIEHIYSRGIAYFLVIMAFIACIAYRWREKPPFLRGSLLMLAPNLAAYLTVGFHGEFRGLYWSLPVVMLALTHSLARFAGLGEADSMQAARERAANADSLDKR